MELSLDLLTDADDEPLQPQALWQIFVEHLQHSFRAFPPESFRKAWQSHADRTDFYRFMMREVARRMKLELIPEFRKIDFAMAKRRHEALVPVIFVECENITTTAYKEVDKLCWLAAPLRVLMTSVEWDPSLGLWDNGGKRQQLITCWGSIVQDLQLRLATSGRDRNRYRRVATR